MISLAQLGFVWSSSNAILANRAHISLKHEIIEREGGIIKNQYMKKLGIDALIFSVPAFVFVLVLNMTLQLPLIYQTIYVNSYSPYLLKLIKIYTNDFTVFISFHIYG